MAASDYPEKALQALQAHYGTLQDTPSYDAFLRHGHALLKRIGADPYHVRMALTKGYSMMEFGNRAAYQHREVDGQVEIGLLIRMADLGQVDERHKRSVHNFKPVGGMSFIHSLGADWNAIPQVLLDLNEVAMREEYVRIKDTTLVEQRRGSGTDNKALEFAVVNGIPVGELPTPAPEHEQNERTISINTMSIPLNRIFYGPPGTGKTFHTIGAAVQVCDPEFHEENKVDDAALRQRFNELLIKEWDDPNWQIAFCTFHQSFSYEDFVEGIKPVLSEEDKSELSYHVRAGILKVMAERATVSSGGTATRTTGQLGLSPDEFTRADFYKMSLGAKYDREDDDIYRNCIRNNVIAIGYMDQHDLTGKTEREINELPLREGQVPSSSSQMNYFCNHLKIGDYVIVTNGNHFVRAIGRVKGAYRYAPEGDIRYPHLRDVEWIVKDANIPYEVLYTKKFVQRTIYKLFKEDLKRDFFVRGAAAPDTATPRRNYVLIIDEINRGNVAGIFGELITLIEENKRKGRPEALEVTLPYSQEPFSIPDNLYIIGTMNTADRSVEALDAALRRRFNFVPMMPDTTGLKPLQNTSIDLKALLNKLNARLVQLLDEDHQIGHSHFWDLHLESDPVAALRRVFKDKIIPQLEEYFHRDRSKLRLVLGERFVERLEPDDEVFLGDADDLSVESRPTYRITAAATWDENAFVSIHG